MSGGAPPLKDDEETSPWSAGLLIYFARRWSMAEETSACVEA
ncbi:hypothetical protein ACFQ64_19795 [Streptomyces sp. NPDC056460]